MQGDKIKWVYLKDNPYQMEAIAFLEFDLPQKMKDFINEYIDRGKSFETILQNKLQKLILLTLSACIDKFNNYLYTYF